MTDWLKLASDAYDSSTSYVDANYRREWEDAIKMFNNEHPANSKYNSEGYRHRSKIFRPKSRSVVRKNEAAAAAAFFSNQDVVSIDAEDDNNPIQQASASVVKELINYRLQKTIPWFQILVGGVQDAQVQGVVCSYQYWKYKAKKEKYRRVITDEFGFETEEEFEQLKVIDDKPCIELIPIENTRFSPAASWIDPVNTSPYFIWKMPMYIGDIKAMMDATDDKTGQPKWKRLEEEELTAAAKEYDPTRMVRDGNREDAKELNQPVNDFETVWVHLNIIRQDDQDWVFYTLGTLHLLSTPKRIEEVYLHGQRPFAIGCAIIETHKTMPSGVVKLGEGLQLEANEIVNQRLDNVKLVLNKRYLVKRGRQVDIQSLLRNVPGSVTQVDNVNEDVGQINFPDVTSSAYLEQDRVNVDYDELVGNFSTSSVSTNRKLGETVGGLGLLNQGATQMQEYLLRTITETWVEKVLRQLVKLEQAYETDEVVLSLAAERAQVFQRYGINQVTDDLLNQELSLRVNVGMGATDPNTKLQKFVLGIKTFADIASSGAPNITLEEISKEIFGALGYRDGKRFFSQEQAINAEQIKQAEAQLQQKAQILAKQEADITDKADAVEDELQKLEFAKKELELAKKNLDAEYRRIAAELELRDIKSANEAENQALQLLRQVDEITAARQ
jgi:hypothetical protein